MSNLIDTLLLYRSWAAATTVLGNIVPDMDKLQMLVLDEKRKIAYARTVEGNMQLIQACTLIDKSIDTLTKIGRTAHEFVNSHKDIISAGELGQFVRVHAKLRELLASLEHAYVDIKSEYQSNPSCLLLDNPAGRSRTIIYVNLILIAQLSARLEQTRMEYIKSVSRIVQSIESGMRD